MTAIKRNWILIALVLLGSAMATPAHATTFVSAGGTNCQSYFSGYDTASQYTSEPILHYASGAANPSTTQLTSFICPLPLGTTTADPQWYDGFVIYYYDNSPNDPFSCRVFQGFNDGTNFYTQVKETCVYAGGCAASSEPNYTGVNYFLWWASELGPYLDHQNVDSNYGISCTIPKKVTSDNWVTSHSWVISYYGWKD